MTRFSVFALAALLFAPSLSLADEAGSAKKGSAAKGSVAKGSAAKGSSSRDWAASVELPAGEQSVLLFNGKDLTGWRKRDDAYFSVADGAIRAANAEPVPRSTYLFTEKPYRNFRLLLEAKQTVGAGYSNMHSAVAVLGAPRQEGKDPFGFTGPLLMFCHDWGIWDAYGRNRIYPPEHKGFYSGKKWEKVGEWNQLEALVIGDRLRMVANGQLVIDYTEKAAGRLKASPIGLQLHNNNQPQEFRFRGLLLVENPKDELITLKE